VKSGRILSWVALVLVIASCSLEPESPTDRFEISVFAKIRRDCTAFPCTIDLQGVTPFSWDNLYVFQSPEQRDEIEQVLKIRLSRYIEGSKYFVFLLNGVVVQEQRTSAGFEKPLRNEILFGNLAPSYVKVSATDRFLVHRSDEGGIVHYVLAEAANEP